MKNISTTEQVLKFLLSNKAQQVVPAIVGNLGVPKTEIVKKVSKELNSELIYFNLAQLSEDEIVLPVIPVQNTTQELQSNSLVEYAFVDKNFQRIFNEPEKEFIIFCDEFTEAKNHVISEWMTILNERQLQGYVFPNNVHFVVAMNPSTEIAPAHANRFTFLHVEDNWID